MSGETSGNASALSTSSYARQKAQLNSLINSLRATGISQDLALPTVVVIGNQSSGKSSLLEAISCVNFPRASGTCTRVPTEVAMKRADTWQAQVSVRFEVDGQGRPLKKVKQLAFGEPLTDPTQVADMLRRAQLALLKNDQDIQKYFTIDIQAHNFPTTISFSPNPVLLDISGPDYVDLSLVDLPGIVQSGQDSDVALVKQIVESYIKSDTSIIVIAINMSDDLQNQAAVSIARKVDPNGHRTIGVLTKADRLEKGNELDWLKLLRGETDSRLSLGYFVTRQPTPEELASEISFVDARKKEKDFYDTQQPWNHLYSERSRFGTPNIARFLSDQLTHAIHDQLPKLMDSITQAEEHTTLQLSKLPPPPAEDALHELKLVQGINQEWDAFVLRVRKSRPEFVPRESSLAKTDTQSHVRLRMHVDEVKAFVDSKLAREMPFTVPSEAKSDLVIKAIATWEKLAVDFLDECRLLIEDEISEIVGEHFSHLNYHGLQDEVNKCLYDTISELYDKTYAAVLRRCAQDKLPSTRNMHYLSDSRDLYLASYKGESPTQPASSAGAKTPASSADADAALKNNARQVVIANLHVLFPGQKISAENLPKVLESTKWEGTFQVMSEVAAYVKVASKRFQDNIMMEIESDLVQPLPSAFFANLQTKLGLTSSSVAESANRLLAEDPFLTKTRADLRASKVRLEESSKLIKMYKRQSAYKTADVKVASRESTSGITGDMPTKLTPPSKSGLFTEAASTEMMKRTAISPKKNVSALGDLKPSDNPPTPSSAFSFARPTSTEPPPSSKPAPFSFGILPGNSSPSNGISDATKASGPSSGLPPFNPFNFGQATSGNKHSTSAYTNALSNGSPAGFGQPYDSFYFGKEVDNSRRPLTDEEWDDWFRMLPSNATDGTPLDRYPIPLYGSKNALKTVQMPDLGHILGTWHSLSAQKEFWNVSQEEIRWIDYRAGLKGPA